MNNQQAFDQVWQYFIVEKHPAGVIKGILSYSAPCAIGVLLTPSQRAEADSHSSNWVVDRFLPGLEPYFVGRLQSTHDYSANLWKQDKVDFHQQLEIELRSLAARFELVVPA